MKEFKLHGVRHVAVDLLPNGDGRKTHSLHIIFKNGAEVRLVLPFKGSADLQRCSSMFEPRLYFLKSSTGRYVCADTNLGFSTTKSQRKAHPFASLEKAQAERDRLLKYWQNNISLRVVSLHDRGDAQVALKIAEPEVRTRVSEPRLRIESDSV